MEQQDHVEFGWQQKLRMTLCVLFLLWLNLTLVSNAQAQMGLVKVLILEGGGNDCQDSFGSDFYFRVTIDNQRFSTRNRPIHVGAATLIVNLPVNREFSALVDLSRDIQISFEQWERDDSFAFLGDDDDICDIFPGPGNGINVVLNPANCQVSGDVSGACDTTLGFDGFPEHFLFRISVEPPPRTPGLAIRCLHDPIWPQPGDTVTITAEALDGNANPIFGPVDNVEIRAGDDNSRALIGNSTNSTFQVNHTPASGVTELLYGCSATDKDQLVSSNWHRVQIGQPPRGRAVGILNTGASNHSVDIVFIRDKTSYSGGANDPNFLNHVSEIIRNAYYAGSGTFLTNAGLLFLQNQDMINFWIALDEGEATGSSLSAKDCKLTPPGNWDSDYTFADAGAIVHTAMFRDCARPQRHGLFSADIGSIATILHETGHAPFGLADEYCCDGGYFPKFASSQNTPNTYDNLAACLRDPLASTFLDPCQQISGNACIGGQNPNLSCIPDSANEDTMRCGMGVKCLQTSVPWYRLDSLSTITNDLMVNNGDAQSADQRRINNYFKICRDLKRQSSKVQGRC